MAWLIGAQALAFAHRVNYMRSVLLVLCSKAMFFLSAFTTSICEVDYSICANSYSCPGHAGVVACTEEDEWRV